MKYIVGKWFSYAVFSFLITIFLGLVLRWAFVFELPEWLPFRYVLHAHSHVAMLGWIYSAFFVLIVHWYDLYTKSYTRLFWITQVSILGMTIGFLFQGYGLISILFTSIHIILSYIFAFKVLKELHGRPNSASIILIRSGIFFLLLSTLGPWALGIIMNSPLKGSSLYYGTIQFFLHFQFNGWMVFTVLALFFKYLENTHLTISNSTFQKFYLWMVVSTCLTFALAITWSTPHKVIFWINSTGVILQLLALYYLFLIFRVAKKEIRNYSGEWAYWLFIIAFWSFCLKIITQGLVAIPDLAIVSYTIRNFVVGFIHLVMLGVISHSIFGMIGLIHSSNFNKSNRWGFRLYIFGFLITEFLLFVQGILLWLEKGYLPYYHTAIFGFSTLIFFGVLIYFVRIRNINGSKSRDGFVHL